MNGTRPNVRRPVAGGSQTGSRTMERPEWAEGCGAIERRQRGRFHSDFADRRGAPLPLIATFLWRPTG